MLNSWLKANLSSVKLRRHDIKASNTILLKEKDANVNMTVRIIEAPDTVTTIRLDSVQHLNAFSAKGGLKQVCDYLLVSQSDERCYAIFVELKKKLKGEIKPLEQLRRSLPLFHYFLSVFEVDGGSRVPDSKIVVSYLLIGQQSSPNWDKQFVKFDPSSIFETEEYRSIKIRSSVARAIPFSELVKG